MYSKLLEILVIHSFLVTTELVYTTVDIFATLLYPYAQRSFVFEQTCLQLIIYACYS